MCNPFHDLYANSNSFNKAAIQARIMNLQYAGEKMYDYVARFQSLSTKLEAMNSSLDEGFLVKLFSE